MEQPLGADDSQETVFGGGRFNRFGMHIVVVVLIVAGCLMVYGIHRAGVRPAATASANNSNDDLRHKAIIGDLWAGAVTPAALATPVVHLPVQIQQPAAAATARAPHQLTRYEQWAQDHFMRALEAPQLVGAFHSGSTAEIARAEPAGSDAGNDGRVPIPNVTLQPPASPYTVVTGSIIPAVMITGLNSDLPGPVLAQVSEPVYDTATGQRLLIPQGSRLVGMSQGVGMYGQDRVAIAWSQLIFPDTSRLMLPMMPGSDESGMSGLTQDVNHHYAQTLGTAAAISLIGAAQTVGQMAVFGGSTYGSGYSEPNQWALATQSAGSGVAAQMGGAGQQLIQKNMNRPNTITVQPGFAFNVMVTTDLVFPGPYKS
jgi:type IV secretory pathway VirB10-like protein